MARQAQDQASHNVDTGRNISSTGMNFANQANQNATNIGNWLTPTLQTQYENPQGFGTDWLNASKTQAGEIAGSKAAGAKHGLDLMAERTGNSAGFAPAQDEAMRESQSELSRTMLGIDTRNAEEKSRESSEALSGMEHMYGENLGSETANLGASTGALNASTGAVNAETNAGNSGWLQNTLAIMNALKPKKG